MGTVTEIYDYLRILFARLGHPFCPKCGVPIGTQTADEIVEKRSFTCRKVPKFSSWRRWSGGMASGTKPVG